MQRPKAGPPEHKVTWVRLIVGIVLYPLPGIEHAANVTLAHLALEHALHRMETEDEATVWHAVILTGPDDAPTATKRGAPTHSAAAPWSGHEGLEHDATAP